MNILKKIRFVAIALLIGVFLVGESSAQNGTLSGKVVDKNSGEALAGASVVLIGTKYGAKTDAKGEFSIENISSLYVKFKTTYIGYYPDTTEISFSGKKRVNITIEMAPTAQQLKGIQVEGKAEGQVGAFLEQKRSISVKNVVAAEQIEEFPDLNAADAMARIPGVTLQRDQGEGKYVQLRGTPPELTSFNINGEQIPSPEGNVRYVGMDIIAADQIEQIEITKALTPDMDADGIGGSVNIITKKAQSEKPDIRATLAGGYGALRGGDNYQAQFSYGQRRDNFGFNMNGSYYLSRQGSDNMEYSFGKGPFIGEDPDTINPQSNYHVQYRNVQLRYYDITRERIGVSGTLDYEFAPESVVYLRGMFNQFLDDETRYRKTYDLDDAFTEYDYLYGGIEYDVKDREKIQNISSLNLGTEAKVLGSYIDFETAYAIATENQPDRLEVRFDNPGQAIRIAFDHSDRDWPKVKYPDPKDTSNISNYDRYDLDEILFERIDISDKNLTSKINFKIPYDLDIRNNGFVKFGGKVRFKKKTRDITASSYQNYDTTSKIYAGVGDHLSLQAVSGDFRETDFLSRGYRLDIMPDPGLTRDFFEKNFAFFRYHSTDTRAKTYGEDYTAYEDIYATYVMVRHDYDNIMFLGGVRYEKTDIDYEGIKLNFYRGILRDSRDIDTLRDKRSHEFVLPQFQVKYSLDPNTNIRAAYTYTYSRPNFEDVLPYREEDQKEIRYGNPDLEFPLSMNLDLLAERYLLGGGIISGGVFYKNIDNFIFYYKRFAHEGDDPGIYSLVEITKAINGLEANVYGAELQTQFKFDFIDGFFSDFGIYANYTYTHSEAFINKRYPANDPEAVVVFGEDDLSLYADSLEKETITLPGQAMHTANLALFYDSENLYVKLMANYHDDFLYELGADPDLDEFYDEALRLDFTANFAVNDNLKIFADVNNITNAPLKFYLGKREENRPFRLKQQEYYSWTARIGIKLAY